jgi:hypothetical protein
MTGLDRVLRSARPALLAVAGALVWAAPALADDAAIQAKIERRLHKAGLADAADVQSEVGTESPPARRDHDLEAKRSAGRYPQGDEDGTNLVQVSRGLTDADILGRAERHPLSHTTRQRRPGCLGRGGGAAPVRTRVRRRDIEGGVAFPACGTKNEIQSSRRAFTTGLIADLRCIYGDIAASLAPSPPCASSWTTGGDHRLGQQRSTGRFSGPCQQHPGLPGGELTGTASLLRYQLKAAEGIVI